MFCPVNSPVAHRRWLPPPSSDRHSPIPGGNSAQCRLLLRPSTYCSHRDGEVATQVQRIRRVVTKSAGTSFQTPQLSKIISYHSSVRRPRRHRRSACSRNVSRTGAHLLARSSSSEWRPRIGEKISSNHLKVRSIHVSEYLPCHVCQRV